jgi:hypothetical protein
MELAAAQPDGPRDTVFQIDDGVSVVRFVESGEHRPEPLRHGGI